MQTGRLFLINFLTILCITLAASLFTVPTQSDMTQYHDTTIQQASTQISPAAPLTTSTNVSQQKYREILLPTVRIKTAEGTGSGVVIQSNKLKDGTYENVILTAKHVVSSEFGDILFTKVKVYCYWTEFGDMVPFEGVPIAFNEKTDLALVILQYDGKMPYVAKMLPEHKVTRAFQKVYAVGCTLGIIPPSPSEGIVSIPYVQRSRLGPMIGLATTPVAGGNSGGGMYAKFDNTWYLIGIVSSTSVDRALPPDQDIAIPYPNHTWYVSDVEIRDFLFEEGF